MASSRSSSKRTVLLQAKVSPELIDVLDDHVERLQNLYPQATVTRSAVVRQWLETAYHAMEDGLLDLEARDEEHATRKQKKVKASSKLQYQPPKSFGWGGSRPHRKR